jgi:hypothetical protein
MIKMDRGFNESRLFPRIKFTGSLRCQIRGSGEVTSTVSEDLSLCGVKFIHPKFIPSQTPVMLEINLFSQVVRPIAQIIWSTPFSRQDKFHLGAKFLEWDPKEKKNLAEFINLRLKQY